MLEGERVQQVADLRRRFAAGNHVVSGGELDAEDVLLDQWVTIADVVVDDAAAGGEADDQVAVLVGATSIGKT